MADAGEQKTRIGIYNETDEISDSFCSSGKDSIISRASSKAIPFIVSHLLPLFYHFYPENTCRATKQGVTLFAFLTIKSASGIF